MKLARLGTADNETPALLHEGKYYNLRGPIRDIDGDFFSRDDMDRVRDALAASTLTPTKDACEMQVGAPIARPSAIASCIGMNYASGVADFVAVDDVSERRFQLTESRGQWSKGKTAPNFTRTRPWLSTQDLRLYSWVNGEPRQDSSTADMIFSVDRLIWHLPQYLALEPGDLLLTGTPQGVALSGRFPYLVAVRPEIDGLGAQEHTFVPS